MGEPKIFGIVQRGRKKVALRHSFQRHGALSFTFYFFFKIECYFSVLFAENYTTTRKTREVKNGGILW